MRIRKRLVPSSPLPLADPQLIHQSVVVQLPPRIVVAESFQECTTNYQPSDPPNQPPDGLIRIPDGIAQCVSPCTPSSQAPVNPKDLEGKLIIEDHKSTSNGVTREECTSNAGVDNIALLLSASSSSEQDRRWDDGDKVVPLKKRKQSGLERVNVKAKWKSKTNKKCLQINGDENDDGADNSGIVVHGGRKKRRGVDIMEGLRCSRANGRGWRCCQPTMVGYSLCDHHLGKGRLRSKSSVRNNTSKSRRIESVSKMLEENESLLMTMPYNEDGNDDDGDEKPKRVVIKKKRKLGVVKARSMSRLLWQLDSNKAVVVEANDMKKQ